MVERYNLSASKAVPIIKELLVLAAELKVIFTGYAYGTFVTQQTADLLCILGPKAKPCGHGHACCCCV